ncbi:MAG: oxygen-independent coproporphyrinogen-3 oxidase [Cyclobacteriaceae bacterium]
MIDALCKEIIIQKDYLHHKEIKTIYFGGGTPSLLEKKELQKILGVIQANFSVSKDAEITMEVNPDDLSTEKLDSIIQNGINRLSIGIQSFNDDFLTFFNRAHNAQMAQDSVKNARSTGFENISVDLIFGIPNQSTGQFENDLKKIIALDTEHISIYGLTIEEKTVFGKWLDTNKIRPIDDEVAAAQLEMIMSELPKAGFRQYEISSFSKPNFESKHNSNYWTQEYYLGIGPSAHSYNGISRQGNASNNAKYISSIRNGKVPFDLEMLDRSQKINEHILTRIRTLDGISLNQLKTQFDFDFVEEFKKEIKNFVDLGLVVADNNLYLTQKGKFVADSITESFMID